MFLDIVTCTLDRKYITKVSLAISYDIWHLEYKRTEGRRAYIYEHGLREVTDFGRMRNIN